jgi:hypothetical protein
VEHIDTYERARSSGAHTAERRGSLLSEGIQKFLFPDQLGAGRFLKIGLPMPDVLGPFAQGFWYMAHESRTDWSMLLGALFLLIVGAGPGRSTCGLPAGVSDETRRIAISCGLICSLTVAIVAGAVAGPSPGSALAVC